MTSKAPTPPPKGVVRPGRAPQTNNANPADWPSTHLGEIEASATPKGATITLRDDICHMDVHWLGDALVVSDNAECGGMNVRFNGVYQRAAKR